MYQLGQSLYESYREACMEMSGCGTDPWESLDEAAQREWERTAELFMQKTSED